MGKNHFLNNHLFDNDVPDKDKSEWSERLGSEKWVGIGCGVVC